MGKEIVNQSKQPFNLLTKTLTPQELQSHGDKVGLRLEIVSRKYDRFGWDQISKEVRALLRADWIGKLIDFDIDEIDDAISKYVDDVKNKKAPHEGHIKTLAIKARQLRLANIPKQIERQNIAEPSQASKDRVAAMVKDFADRRKMKTKPLEN